MKEIKPSYCIKYYNEDESNTKHYKKVNISNPFEVDYEDGMHYFYMQKMIVGLIDGQKVYIIVEDNHKKYAFGELDSIENLLNRVKSGEEFFEDYREILEDYIGKKPRKFFVSGKKVLESDIYDEYLPIDYSKNNALSDDADIDESSLISAKNVWYVEYKKYGDDELHYKPTYCNDKEFRYDEDVEEYRFVRVAEFNFNGKKYQIMYDREEELYKPQEPPTRDEVDEAIDAVKYMIYNSRSQGEHPFNGYTPVYPFNTEDSSSVFRKQQKYIKGQDVLTVTGSGDALIDLFLYGAENVTCFDANKTAKYYAKLKFYAIKSGLSYDDYLSFFLGERTGSGILSRDIYNKFSSTLDADTKKFWDSIYKYLNDSDQRLTYNNHSMLYSIVSFFGTSNYSYRNSNSYCSEENYERAQKIIQTKNSENIKFIDAPLFELENHVEDNKFNYVYFSNIMDFTSTFIMKNSLHERLKVFKDFVSKIFFSKIKENGIIDVGFIKKQTTGDSDNVVFKTYEYSEIFTLDENFVVQNLQPYNNNDYLITFNSRPLEYNNFRGKVV